jgi:hypothetical protein
MSTYQSDYTGAQIDEGVGKGLSSVQPDTDASLKTLTLGVASAALTEGQIAWNPDEGTLDVGLNGGEVVLQAGQEIMYRVLNQSGSTIPNGALVMAAGSPGMSGVIRADLADASGAVPAKFILGLATEDILPEDEGLEQTGLGYVTHFGKVRGIDTTAWSAGDVLWADPETPGGLTNVEPEAPNIKLPIAFVLSSHATVGTLMVRMDSGASLRGLHDVEILTPIGDSDVLVRDPEEERWVTRQLSLFDLAGTTLTETPSSIDDLDVTVTSGSLPTPSGAFTIADAASPTTQELLRYIVELEGKVQDLVHVVEGFGLADPRT